MAALRDKVENPQLINRYPRLLGLLKAGAKVIRVYILILFAFNRE